MPVVKLNSPTGIFCAFTSKGRNMTPTEINTEIAIATGFCAPNGIWSLNGIRTPIPNYCNDLNAMHEVTSVLGDRTTQRFTDELIKATKADSHGVAVIYSSLYDATAAQRAEAFLRTIGKWEEGE
jgi:hypothetical protein